MKKTLALLALAASLALPSFVRADDAKGYPAVSAAIKATENAIAALGRVKADLGAHQAAANTALNTALTELNAGLAEAKAAKATKATEKKAEKKAAKEAAKK